MCVRQERTCFSRRVKRKEKIEKGVDKNKKMYIITLAFSGVV